MLVDDEFWIGCFFLYFGCGSVDGVEGEVGVKIVDVKMGDVVVGDVGGCMRLGWMFLLWNDFGMEKYEVGF